MKYARVKIELLWVPAPDNLIQEHPGDVDRDFAWRDFDRRMRIALQRLSAEGTIRHYHVLEAPDFVEE